MMEFIRKFIFIVIGIILLILSVCGNFPLLDVDTNMRIVLVPHDMPVQTTFYRIKASDSDHNFPLSFEVLGTVGKALISILFLGCSETESLCQADVVLNKELDVGRTYEFQLRVTDTTGDFTRVKAAICATEGTAFLPSMLGPKILQIPENMEIGTQLAKFVVIKNELNSRTVLLEIREPNGRLELRQKLLSNNRTEGSLFLKKKLDFETEPWFTFQLLAMNGRTNISVDTRNVLVSQVVVGVEDVQDTPPVFTTLSNFVEISTSMEKGDLVTRVSAEDGDKQNKRLIRYGLLADSNPFVAFFDLDPISGEIRLRRNIPELLEMARPNEHIQISVIAEEIMSPSDAAVPAKYTRDNSRTVRNITLWITHSPSSPHQLFKFSSNKYVGEIRENALIGEYVKFTLDTKVWSIGQAEEIINICFETIDVQPSSPFFQTKRYSSPLPFEIIPQEGRGNFTFEIRVMNSEDLDFEQSRIFRLKMSATSLSGGNSSCEVEIHIRDENDCKPIFTKKEYYVEIAENSSPGTSVTQVHATDCDSGNFGKITYSQLVGSEAFYIDPLSGEVTVDKADLLDREAQSEIRFYVEAKDGGYSDTNTNITPQNIGTAMVVVKLTDMNDSPPIFEHKLYRAILTPDLDGLRWPVQVKATDGDSNGSPNSQIRYQVIGDTRFVVDSVTGELRVKTSLQNLPTNPYLGTIRIEAKDLGSPSLKAETRVELFADDVLSQEIQFLFPTSYEKFKKDKEKIEVMLSTLIGGHASVKDISPYNPSKYSLKMEEERALQVKSRANPESNYSYGESEEQKLQKNESSEKTLVTATVYSPISAKNRVIDLETFRAFMVTEETKAVTTDKTEVKTLQSDNQSLFWLLISLIIILLILFLIFLCCIFCPCCWISRSTAHNRTKSKSNKVIDKRRELDIEKERIQIVESGRSTEQHKVRKPVQTILEDEDGYNLNTVRFPLPRQAWSGDELEVRGGGNRKVRQNQQSQQQIQLSHQRVQLDRSGDILIEDWEHDRHHRDTPAPQFHRSEVRGEEILPRWQVVQQPRRNVGYGGSQRGADEEFFGQTTHTHRKRNDETREYFGDNYGQTRPYGGYLTGERHRQFIRHSSPLRSPPHSLPPIPHATEYRIDSERHPNTRFFKTEMGEVLQLDFDGEEGKEMLMRRFIDEQKPRGTERLSNIEQAHMGLYGRTQEKELRLQRTLNDEGFVPNRRHHHLEEESYAQEQPEEKQRPKAAILSRRHVFPPREIPELVEEADLFDDDEEAQLPVQHTRGRLQGDLENHHRREKSKEKLHKDKDTRSYKSKDRSRSRETDDGQVEPLGHRDTKAKSREKSKSPRPPQLTVEKVETDQGGSDRERSHSHSRSRKSKRRDEKEEKVDISKYPVAIKTSTPNQLHREIIQTEQVREDLSVGMERTGSRLVEKSESIEIGVGMGNLIFPDHLDLLEREEDEDSGIGIVGVAQRSKMLEKKSVFTIAYDEMATHNVLRPDTAINNGS